MQIGTEISFRAKIIVTSLSGDIHYTAKKYCDIVYVYKSICYYGFTIKIKLSRYKRYNDRRCAYKNTGSSHLYSLR